MFANPIWSVLLLVAPFALYWFVIRPQLGTGLTEIYNEGSLWQRIKARIYAFRTVAIASLGAVLAGLPDLLVQIAPLDFSSVLPRPWGGWVATGVSIAIAVMKAYETKPGEQK